MAKILFLVPYPSGEAPSQRFRFEQYFVSLEKASHQYEVHSFLDVGTWQILYKKGNNWAKIKGIVSGFWRRFQLLWGLKKFDFVFIHREATPIGLPWVEWYIAKIARKKIIFDFDDAIWLPDSAKTGFLKKLVKCYWKTSYLCRYAYKVSAGNDYLCDYALQYNSNTFLNPTTIDTENLHNPFHFEQLTSLTRTKTIGWTGTHSTLMYLDFLVPILQKLEQKYAFVFLVIANKMPHFQLKSLRYVPWQKTTEIADLMQMDLGLMPLTDDAWAKGKCGFKALQYMSLGIPAVASPVGVNTKMIEHGKNGWLCDTAKEWELILTQWLNDEGFDEKEMSANARQSVIQYYSVKSNEQNFLHLFEHL
ncbi:MAG: glycosyltransferase [Cytophagales bacterium]|nr:MAG: glycosyltransferase [Cytophagales bacterium]